MDHRPGVLLVAHVAPTEGRVEEDEVTVRDRKGVRARICERAEVLEVPRLLRQLLRAHDADGAVVRGVRELGDMVRDDREVTVPDGPNANRPGATDARFVAPCGPRVGDAPAVNVHGRPSRA